MKAVQTLQLKTFDSTVPMSELLRMAYTVAYKLHLDDFKKWISSEMDGYKATDSLPEYRFIQGVMLAFNPVLGWQTVKVYDPKMIKYLNRIAMTDKISEIEHLLERSEDSQFVYQELPLQVRKHFAEHNFGMSAIVLLNDQKLAGIINSVRNKILEWTLKLEQEGVLGEDMNFNEQEQERAANITYNNIVNNSVIHAPFQQGYSNDMKIEDFNNNLEITRELLDAVKSILNNFGEQDKAELQADLDTIESQIKSPKPKMNIIKSTFNSIKNVIEGAIGSSIANIPAVTESFNNLVNRIGMFVSN